ncbi:hypothetical protein SK128_025479, partial [Halocaridina rubra]
MSELTEKEVPCSRGYCCSRKRQLCGSVDVCKDEDGHGKVTQDNGQILTVGEGEEGRLNTLVCLALGYPESIPRQKTSELHQ